MSEGTSPVAGRRLKLAPDGGGLEDKNKTTKNLNMKPITKTITYLQLAALCFATAVAGPNLRAKEKDVKGSIASVETFDFTTGQVDGSGTGVASHLGRFTYTYHFVVHVLSTGIAVGVGTAEFTAANGDSFSTEIAAESAGPQDILEHHTIVGGTGRFAGASGTFILDRFITESSGNVNVSDGAVAGTIVTAKSK